MSDLSKIQRSHVRLMRLTLETLQNIISQVDEQTAKTLRDPDDGDKGWTVTEVVGHLLDFDCIFRSRAEMIRDQQTPELPAYDHEQLAIDHRYNERDLTELMAELVASREETRAFFTSLDEAQWQRDGIHPEQGHFTMTDAAIQIGHHELLHLEQITRILAQPTTDGT